MTEKLRESDQELTVAIQKRIAAGHEEAIRELKFLVNWIPGCGFPRNITPTYGRDDTPRKELQTVPFVTETYTYALWGKDDARTFMGTLSRIARGLGVELEDLYEGGEEKENG